VWSNEINTKGSGKRDREVMHSILKLLHNLPGEKNEDGIWSITDTTDKAKSCECTLFYAGKTPAIWFSQKFKTWTWHSTFILLVEILIKKYLLGSIC
jgi:hypothetical protein